MCEHKGIKKLGLFAVDRDVNGKLLLSELSQCINCKEVFYGGL